MPHAKKRCSWKWWQTGALIYLCSFAVCVSMSAYLTVCAGTQWGLFGLWGTTVSYLIIWLLSVHATGSVRWNLQGQEGNNTGVDKRSGSHANLVMNRGLGPNGIWAPPLWSLAHRFHLKPHIFWLFSQHTQEIRPACKRHQILSPAPTLLALLFPSFFFSFFFFSTKTKHL